MKGRYFVAEGPSGVYRYHLRWAADGKQRLGGLTDEHNTALCGARLGWDVRTPVEAYGHKHHLIRFCDRCLAVMDEENSND